MPNVNFSNDATFNATFGTVTKVSGGTNDYEDLKNKPSIEGVELVGNKGFPELGLEAMTPQEIDEILYGG